MLQDGDALNVLLLDASVAVQVELGLAACSSGVGDDHAGAMATISRRAWTVGKTAGKYVL